MKLAFISDIHGNAIALDAVLADIKGKDVDKIFVLGDICYRGPEPQRSLDIVQSLGVDVIKGNADEWVVRGVETGEVPEAAHAIMNEERDWAVEKLNKKSIEYLEALPSNLELEIGGVKINAFHATPKSLFDAVQPNESDEMIAEKLMDNEADIYLYGHIHKAYIRYMNGKCVINTGSVGLPFDGLNKASYSIVDINEGKLSNSIVRVDYDVDKVIKQFEESDYPNKELMIKLLKQAAV